jgi:hypothetical protein
MVMENWEAEYIASGGCAIVDYGDRKSWAFVVPRQSFVAGRPRIAGGSTPGD